MTGLAGERETGAGPGGPRLFFVSDCHVSPAEPEKTRRLRRFLEAAASGPGRTLYLLGDLFETWIGPAHVGLPDHRDALEALRCAVKAGLAVRFLYGNRDFLAGEELERATGVRVVGDEELLEVDGKRVLLLHGDVFCTRDTRYMAYRRLARAGPVRGLLRALPAPVLRRLAGGVRGLSKRIGETPGASAVRALVPSAIEGLFRRRALDAAICGHTHCPGRIELRLEPGPARPLYVLGAWEGPAVYLEYADREFRFRTFV